MTTKPTPGSDVAACWSDFVTKSILPTKFMAWKRVATVGGRPPRTWEKRVGSGISGAAQSTRSPFSSTCLAMCRAKLVAPAPAEAAR